MLLNADQHLCKGFHIFFNKEQDKQTIKSPNLQCSIGTLVVTAISMMKNLAVRIYETYNSMSRPRMFPSECRDVDMSE